MLLAATSSVAFIHAYRFELFDWEIYGAFGCAAVATAFSIIGFRRASNRVISAISGTVGLIVLGHSLTEIVMEYAFTGHLP